MRDFVKLKTDTCSDQNQTDKGKEINVLVIGYTIIVLNEAFHKIYFCGRFTFSSIL